MPGAVHGCRRCGPMVCQDESTMPSTSLGLEVSWAAVTVFGSGPVISIVATPPSGGGGGGKKDKKEK
jgi:hypothetical protein